MSQLNRRHFLKSSVVFAAPWIVPSSVLGRDNPPPSERIQIGIIGLGSRGFNLLDDALAQSDARVTALCDVHPEHHRDRPWGTGKRFGTVPAQEAVRKKYGEAAPIVSGEFRELCQRDDLDAIIVATPDHWHARCTLSALQNGKDVYCEKPVTHFFAEGQAIYRAVAKHDAIFQTGSQQRSDWIFQQAAELVRNGVLGDLKEIKVGLPVGYEKPNDSTVVEEIPQNLDYEMWCGPAPKLPYMRARHHRWWRGHRAFGGGVLMDWIGHHNDIAHWSMDLDQSGPKSVEAVDWTFPESKIYNTPHHYTIRCEYENGVTSTISDSNEQGVHWIGSEGWIRVRRGKFEASDTRWTKQGFSTGSIRLTKSPGHMRNFLDGIRTRSECIASAETAHRSITPGHLGYVSQQVGRKLNWDAKQERGIDDDEANRLLGQMEYRAPWTLS